MNFIQQFRGFLPVAQVQDADTTEQEQIPEIECCGTHRSIAESDELSAWRSEHSTSSPFHPPHELIRLRSQSSHPFGFSCSYFSRIFLLATAGRVGNGHGVLKHS
jgi:hypothetical protein